MRLLIADGWRVFGTTRSAERAEALSALGVEPVVVDVFDRDALRAAARRTRPTALVHQLTDLPRVPDPAPLRQALERNARIREEGTQNLLDAFTDSPVTRVVVQSIAFAYAPGPMPYSENAPLNTTAPDPIAARSARSVATMEQLVLGAEREALILRYGRLYGPRTWSSVPPDGCAVHVDAAADAARRALTRGQRGIYNVAEAGGNVDVQKARVTLGWDSSFRVAAPSQTVSD